MRKINVIAIREYLAMVRTKTFIVTIVMMPLLMLGGLIVQKALEGRVDVSDRKIVVVDPTGELFDGLNAFAAIRNTTQVMDQETGRQTAPKFLLEKGPTAPLTDEQHFELSQKVRKDELFAFIEIAPDILEAQPGQVRSGATIYAESIGAGSLTRWTLRGLNTTLMAHNFEKAGVSPQVMTQAMVAVDVENHGLSVQEADGTIKRANATERRVAQFVPLIIMILMFATIMIVAQPMLQSVIEEKQQRIAEVLLGSSTPFELMSGKLLGNVAVALTILVVYGGGSYFLADRYDMAQLLPTHLLGWFLIFEILSVLFYGSIFIAIGAAVSELREAQSLLTPIIMVLIFPLMVWIEILNEPTGSFATWLSLFPPATPMLMPMRMCVTDAIGLWQPLLGVALVLVCTVATVWAAGRVFRVGLLMQGKAPKPGEILKWIFKG